METVESVGRGWYNYYHQKSRVETKDGKAEENWYDRDLSKEEVNASNSHTLNRESYGADLCRKLHETYAGVAAANRARYSNVKDMRSAVCAKYMLGSEYQQYSREERSAMASNEIQMTEFGSLSLGQAVYNDPHLSGQVSTTRSDTPEFNAKMLSKQIGNVFQKNGIDLSSLGGARFQFTVNGMTNRLGVSLVSGNADSSLLLKMTKALNRGKNSENLFFNLLYEGSRKGTHDAAKLAKWSLWKDFSDMTGRDIRDAEQTKTGFLFEDGQDARDIYKKALQDSTSVPAEYKGAAYENFEKHVENALQYDMSQTPDLELSMSFEAGQAILGGGGIDVMA